MPEGAHFPKLIFHSGHFKEGLNRMRWRSAKELRELFLSYFEEKGCRRYPSFPLVPDDPTLLFTIAGMVPFKPFFLGLREPEVTRATTSQKCVRTNDIDNVGKTARHHTFFEMLGNFSFGDYFKKEVIPWAWEFLTERIGLDPSRLYATIYLDDDEAFDIWHRDVGLNEDRIVRLGEDDNFWTVGPVGPCGPCSEIIYDQGPEFSCGKPTCGVGCSCDRYLEIWNLVFMQFNRQEDGSLTPLPKKNIDTGMGLERLSSVVQRVRTDFETDLFMPLIERTCALSGVRYGETKQGDLAVRVISDHLRATAFMIADGILPTNEGRGYVLRRLLRRAVRFGRLIGLDEPFLNELLPTLLETMADPYVELVKNRSMIEQVITVEEQRFGRTLEQGSALLEAELDRLTREGGTRLPGAVLFELYDTYGFPVELTKEICQERGFDIDELGFEKEMEAQRERARASSKQTSAVMREDIYTELLNLMGPTPFDGYLSLEETAEVKAIIREGRLVQIAETGDDVEVVLSRTPFYAERGGQVGDQGWLRCERAVARVYDTVYPTGDLTVHKVIVKEGLLRVGMKVEAKVDEKRRSAIKRHHTATHLLHEALVRVLGTHVRQMGSLVSEEILRFDFNHFSPLTREELKRVEDLVNEEILANLPVNVEEMPIEKAQASGAKALFNEKYGKTVRVVTVPGFSSEFCGGTHVRATGDIGLVKILKEEGIGSGMRRITAVAGLRSLEIFREMESRLQSLSQILGTDPEGLMERASSTMEELKSLRRQVEVLALEAALSRVETLVKNPIQVGCVPLVVATFKGLDATLLRRVGDEIRKQLPGSFSLLASVNEGKVAVVGMASESLVQRGVHAGNLVKEVTSLLGGSGGGKASMAQGGGADISKLDEALSRAKEILAKQLEA